METKPDKHNTHLTFWKLSLAIYAACWPHRWAPVSHQPFLWRRAALSFIAACTAARNTLLTVPSANAAAISCGDQLWLAWIWNETNACVRCWTWTWTCTGRVVSCTMTLGNKPCCQSTVRNVRAFWSTTTTQIREVSKCRFCRALLAWPPCSKVHILQVSRMASLIFF